MTIGYILKILNSFQQDISGSTGSSKVLNFDLISIYHLNEH